MFPCHAVILDAQAPLVRVVAMKQLLLICAVVALVGGCGGKKDDGNTGVVNPNKPSPKAVPEKLITDPIVEKAIHKELEQIGLAPTGQLTEADLEKVTWLELNGNQLTEAPEGLEKLTQLTFLNLGGNQLTDVRGLEKLPQLTSLSLSRSQLTSVKGLEKLDQLTRLNLEGNKLTDVKGLENLTKLTLLYLGHNPDLTKAQIDQLKKALPKCGIHSNPTK